MFCAAQFTDVEMRHCIADCLELDETANSRCFYNAATGRGTEGENKNVR